MYTARGFRESEIGDIDVIYANGMYHLFHLVLPNHDYIAHATSKDGMNWKRVKNAIFTGDPGEWDDDMLWTMHVNYNKSLSMFEMYYTGLHRSENGLVQRIGRAVSKDLLIWTKENRLNLPLTPEDSLYETPGKSKRQWISFRDPFLYREKNKEWLLICARTKNGVINRRGCVGLVSITEKKFQQVSPLFFPRVYDDVECPCVVKIWDTYYLIGSIREDVKVHYWFADKFRGEYRAFRNNVLMPKGNYAARIMHDGDHVLIYTFYIHNNDVERGARSLPPPKEVVQQDDGQLRLVSYWRWNEKIAESFKSPINKITKCLKNPTSTIDTKNTSLSLTCRSGYEIFSFMAPSSNFIFEGCFSVFHRGKCGFVFNLDKELNGYYVSLDTTRGLAQLRVWGAREKRIFKDYTYRNLQAGEFTPLPTHRYRFKLIRWGGYIEFCIDDFVVLSLVDQRYNGDFLGVYTESAGVILSDCKIHSLETPFAEEFVI